jgi:hypothetical protein
MSYDGRFDHTAAVQAALQRLVALRQERRNFALCGLVNSAEAREEIARATLALNLRERALQNFCRDCYARDSLLNVTDPDDRAVLLAAGKSCRAAA